VQEKDIRHFTKFVLSSVDPLLQNEFSGVPDNEIISAMEAANDAFVSTGVDMFDCNLDPAVFADEILKEERARTRSSLLSESGQQLYERIVFESAAQVIHFVATWPSFLAVVNKEQLARINQLLAETDRVRWAVTGERDSEVQKFEMRYKRYVVQKLDQLELFGLTLAQPGSRKYPLSTAYISLALADATSKRHVETAFDSGIALRNSKTASENGGFSGTSGSLRSEAAIASFNRILLRGDAGSGKSTLLFWLAVNSARGTLENELLQLAGHVPFILPLRRFAERDLPSPHEFLNEIGKNLVGEMPEGWVNKILRSGHALVLIDGVDELPEDRRDEARTWLQDLITTYPNCRYIITSRPAAAEEKWLAPEGFVALDLLPMGKGDIESFIRHWHDAARETIDPESDEDYKDLDIYEAELISSVNTQRQLRRLASNPLLCALLCTLNRDRRMQLPRGRMELYSAALEMLLVRRDNERKIVHPDAPPLTLQQKKHILGSVAYWLLRNGWTDCTEDQAIEQIGTALRGMPTITDSPESVYKYMMVRSGILRMPVEGRVDFVHRTFQEYLAAERLIAVNDIGILIEHAHLDQWHEAVTMAVGHARFEERATILGELLDRGSREPVHLTRLHLLAAACLENADELDPGIYERVRQSAESLIPPARFSEAKELAAAGETVLELLPRASKRIKVNQAASTIRAAALIGGDAALEVVASYASDSRIAVQKELSRSWQQFDVREYAIRVLSRSPTFRRSMHLDDPAVLDVIEHFEELTTLGVRFPIANLAWLQKVPSLRNLIAPMFSGRLTESDVSCLRNLTDLSLGFTDTSTMKDCLTQISRLDSLRFLSLSSPWQNAGEGPPGEIQPLGSMPNLEGLELIRCGGRPVDFEPDRFPQLKSLSLHSPEQLNLTGIGRLKGLRTLTVQSGLGVTDARDLRYLKNLEQLIVLTVAGVDIKPLAAHVPTTAHVRLFAYAVDKPYSLDLSCFAGRTGLKISVRVYGDLEVVRDGLGDDVTVNVTQVKR
jgi:hypothetical protein